MKILKRSLIGFVLLLVVVAAGFVIWAETPLGPAEDAVAALESTGQVRVTQNEWLVFEPTEVQPTTGLIFYPGARVDERSYAPEMQALAEQGFLAVITPMPLNLAVFDQNAADDVIAAFPQIRHWVIGGHSLGGAIAAIYTYDHPSSIDGIVLWASFTQESHSLANQPELAASAIFGSNDGLVDAEDRAKAEQFLPDGTPMVLIQGGNHAQFGSYGVQSGDNPATISREDQQQQTVAATVALLQRVQGN